MKLAELTRHAPTRITALLRSAARLTSKPLRSFRSGLRVASFVRPLGTRAIIEGSGIFRPDWYLARYPDVAAEGVDPLTHYLRRGSAEGRDPHPLFDTDWYLAQNVDVAAGRVNPLEHYLRWGAVEGRDPHPLFDSSWYLAQYPDVRDHGLNPLVHYVRWGAVELRHPNPYFYAGDYVAQCRKASKVTQSETDDQLSRTTCAMSSVVKTGSARAELNSVGSENPLVHFIRYGIPNGVRPNLSILPARLESFRQRLRQDGNYMPRSVDLAPVGSFPLPGKLEQFLRMTFEDAIVDQVRMQYCFLSFHENVKVEDTTLDVYPEVRNIIDEIGLLATRGGEPTGIETPDATVIIPVHGQLIHTLSCLRAVLSAPTRCTYEIIVADDASNDATSRILGAIGGVVRLHRSEVNRGFLRTCNAAAAQARGKTFVFLNNDTLPLAGWLDELLDGLRADPKRGLMGSKLINRDGTLQEAGGIVWEDGSAWNFGRGGNPAGSAYNYVKEVDFISGAAIAIPAGVWRELGGFDEAYVPAYYEDVDLAFRIRATGLRTVYQPFSNVIHFEGASHGQDLSQGIKAYQVVNKHKFYERWKDTLAADHFSHEGVDVRARDRSRSRPRIVVVDHYVPEPDRDSGSRAMLDYLKLLVSAAFHVTFWPHDLRFDKRYTPPLQRLGIEVIYVLEPPAPRFDDWLAANYAILDYAILSRPHVAREFIESLRSRSAAKIIFFGVDVHFKRHHRQLQATGSPLAEHEMIRWEHIEKEVWSKSDVVCYYSNEESELVQSECPGKATRTVPIFFFGTDRLLETRRRVLEHGIPETKQVMFVAGFRHAPNVDAMLWFAAKVWPGVLTAIPEARLCVVGSFPPPEVRSLASSSILVTGYVSDEVLGLLYLSSSACVVPLRYGAGVKGKVLEAISFGAPVVTTPTGIQGIPNADEFLDVCEEAEGISRALIDILRNPESRVAKILRGLDYLGLHVSESAARRVLASDIPEIERLETGE